MLVRFSRKTYQVTGIRHENGWLRLELKPLDANNSPCLISFSAERGDSGRVTGTSVRTIRDIAREKRNSENRETRKPAA